MADIDTYLRQILSATYGEEVRSSIYNSIKLMNDELNEVDQELTYDQYNKLSPSKQNNGTTYFLKDINKIMKSGVEYGSSGDSLTISTKGNSVRFDATGAPVKEMMIDIKPKQYMNGLSRVYNPGESRNRLDQVNPTVGSLNIMRNYPLPGAFVLNGTAVSDYTFYLGTFDEDDTETTFRLTGCAPGGSFDKYYLKIDGQLASGDRYDYGNGVNFKIASETDTYSVYLVIKSGTTLVNALFKPMIRRPDRYPDDNYYTPYENVCSLYRQSSIKIGAHGKNIFNKVMYQYVYMEHGEYPDINNLPVTDASKGYLYGIQKVIRNTTYTISGAIANGPSEIYFYNSANNITQILPVNTYPFTFRTPEDIYMIGFRFDEDAFDIDTIQIEEGSEATSYESYIDRSETIPLENGEYICGGMYNLETGIFTETWGYMASYDGRDLPGEWLSDRDTYGEKEKPTVGAEIMYELSTPIIRHIPNSGFITRKGTNTIFTYSLSCESFFYITYYTSMLDDIPKYDIISNSAYEALSETDKLNGTMYFINDKGTIFLMGVEYGANGGGGGSGSHVNLLSITEVENSVSRSQVTVETLPTYIHEWDFTQSLVDNVGGVTASLDNQASRDSGGVHLTHATDRLILLPESADGGLQGKTLEIDVANFDFKGSTSNHIRFVCNFKYSAGNSTGSLIWKSSTGWTAYGFASSGSSSTKKWDSEVILSGSTSEIINYFSGKTIKIVYDDDGKPTVYADDVLVGSFQDTYYKGAIASKIAIGGCDSPVISYGDQCYDVTITGVRIYNNR